MADSAATAAAFRTAVEAADLDGVRALLAAEVVLHSPVTFHPYVGRDDVAALLAIVARTFENFRYTDELAGEGTHALVFRAEVEGRELEGIDLLRIDDDGLIADLTVLIRPLSGLLPFAQKMAERVQAAGLATVRS